MRDPNDQEQDELEPLDEMTGSSNRMEITIREVETAKITDEEIMAILNYAKRLMEDERG
jgi:hypothetical protein